MKIYTEFETCVKSLRAMENLEEYSSVKWISGSSPTRSRRTSNPGKVCFDSDSKQITCALGAHKKVSNAEFVRLIANELPKTKTVPLSKMTKAQLLEVIEKNAKGYSDVTREHIEDKAKIAELEKKLLDRDSMVDLQVCELQLANAVIYREGLKPCSGAVVMDIWNRAERNVQIAQGNVVLARKARIEKLAPDSVDK